MKKSPQKLHQNKTNQGISIRDALFAIWRNMHILTLPLIIAMVMCGACFALFVFPKVKSDTCNTNNRIYQSLVNRNQEWIAYFVGLSESPNNAINLESGRYVVRSFWRSTNGEPILLIATQQSYPRTLYGISGYIYTSSDRFEFPDTRYSTHKLSPHIYCYERINS